MARPAKLKTPTAVVTDDNGMISKLELNGILQRLALFEVPQRIAKGYGVPVRLVLRIRNEHAAKIVMLRRNWRNWIAQVEPLCNKNNMLIFLGNLARQSALDKDYRGAIAAAKEVRAVMEREVDEASTLDQAIMDRIMSSEFEEAAAQARMIESESFTEIEWDPQATRAEYVEDSKLQEIDDMLADYDDEEEQS